MKSTKIKYTLRTNRRKRTYTIRRYEGRNVVTKYRSNPQGAEYSENWTENDIKNFLKYSNDYYVVR